MICILFITCMLTPIYYSFYLQMMSSRAIIGDSIIRNVRHLNDTDIFCYRGAKIEDIISIISHDSRVFSQYSCIIFHVGTNNLSVNSSKEIVDLLTQLIACASSFYPNSKFIVSSILPRICDVAFTSQKIKLLNTALTNAFPYFIPSFKVVLSHGHPVPNMFVHDQLHLSQPASIKLRELFAYSFTAFGFPTQTKLTGMTYVYRRSNFFSHHPGDTVVWMVVDG